MSGFGGFGGFGQNNNNAQQSTGFGGFGQSSNTNTGFGTPANNTTGFGGTSNTGGSLFGGGSGFGSSGAFGTPQANTGIGGFGAAKPGGFGTATSTPGTSLFGGSTVAANSGTAFGGFGSTNNNTSSPFGSTNTGGGLFGSASKPAFGGTSSNSSPFGGTTNTGFGATPSAFGGSGTALGGALEQCQGTGAVPFASYVEKDSASGTAQNSFQSISFQAPYQKFSPEELRLADYAQGRKYGNASGTAGAFGTSTGFGGFGSNNNTTTSAFGNSGNTNSSLFGGGASTTPFGQAQSTNTGFGAASTTSGGLFGQKPATTGTGLFGNTQTTTPATGGLFGSNTGTTGGFGSNTTSGFGNTSTTSGGLFGSNNNQAKPGGFSFGAAQPSNTTSAFGATSGTTGGFGNAAPGLFGNNATQNTSSPFGGTTVAQTTSNPFGGFGSTQNQQTGGSSLFGNNQAKPATGSLFGNTGPSTNSGGLFGNNNTTNTASNPFGSSTTNNTSSLFGAKPATTGTGTGLFGNSNTNTATNTGGGLFGSSFGNNQNNQNQQQNTGSSLFGGLNNNQPKPSLFGQNQPTGGSLFGGSNNQSTGGGLFGNNNQNQNQQQPQQSSMFSGSTLFGGSQNQQSQPQSLTASINDPTAFGTASMFSDLGTPEIHNPGPIATPLSSMSKQKKSGVLQMYKMNPGSASRFSTPQKRGFGFSYSTYGTPGSASSTSSTPLLTFGNSMLGSGLGRGLSKSMSTSSLRGSYNSSFNREDSILAPGAFSASPNARFNSTGSMKKLVINRGIRQDLFSPPPRESPQPSNSNGILKKRVSFDSSTIGGTNGNANNFTSPLKQVQNNSATPSSEEQGFLRSSRSMSSNGNSSKAAVVVSEPEMEQVKGNELAIVPEEEAPAPVAPTPRSLPVSQEDQEPGEYFMTPSKEDILEMNRMQRQKVSGFTVGRTGVGSVTFDTPVDLSNIDLDQICGGFVILNVRSATVYPDQSKKPPVGRGLNVPSTISLENSWPRGRDKRNPLHEKAGPRFQKHIERLKKVPDTNFLNYDKETGIWSFTVEHFTTYGLDYDDETDGEGVSEFGMSTLTAPPDTPTPQSKISRSSQPDASFTSASAISGSEPEDTFEFKKRSLKVLPGAFDDQEAYDDEEMLDEDDQDAQSFLDDRSAGSQSDDSFEEPMSQHDHHGQELVIIEDQEMAGSFPQYDATAEHEDDYSQEENNDTMETPGAIVRARMRAMRTSGSPLKRPLDLDGDDWTKMLRRTVSPQKQDREGLKRMRDSTNDGAFLGELAAPAPRPRVVSDGRGFATSIDLMHSLFGEAKSPSKIAKAHAPKGKGFQWPYAKVSKSSDLDESNMDQAEREFHSTMKPSWGPSGTLIFASASESRPVSRNSRESREKNGLLVVQKGGVVSEARDVRFATFSKESSSEALLKQKALTTVQTNRGIPFASLPASFSYNELFHDKAARDPASSHEKLVWELASILFDPVNVPDDLQGVDRVSELLRKDKLSSFWQQLVESATTRSAALAKSTEEKAMACLSGRRISEACGHLLNGKDFHLATLVSLIGGNGNMRKSIREQLNDWQKSRVLSEFNQPIRAIYEMLSGNVCACSGSKQAAIEDRIETFVISKRFGLDWRQAFGLRLWYAIEPADDLAEAVHLFFDDLQQDKEIVRPQAWYVEQGISPLWDDEDLESREDLLWGLLKLYALQDADLEAVLRPENSQLSPLDVRLAWQLSRALTSSRACSYGDDADDKADQLTLAFASQLVNEGNWLDATFVLLHLSSDVARIKNIQDHLAHHAGRIGSEDSKAFATLAHDLHIPTSWIWEAKALYMRSVVKDPKREVECLLRAQAFDEAHRTFSKDVAPNSVIERDWETLHVLLSGFNGHEASIAEWRLGGEMYADYLRLLEAQKKGLASLDGTVLERLMAALPAMAADGRGAGFLEMVAVQEISGVVAKLVIGMGKDGKVDISRVSGLPLTEDRHLKHSVDLSLDYYRNLMAGRR